mmetsp:Transcript_2046/g.4672  ORF Transcript_2046/g.4672 Transcript_2046/m.4672 type:complete len:362 (-) Transcript_2046:366-1451(-)
MARLHPSFGERPCVPLVAPCSAAGVSQARNRIPIVIDCGAEARRWAHTNTSDGPFASSPRQQAFKRQAARLKRHTAKTRRKCPVESILAISRRGVRRQQTSPRARSGVSPGNTQHLARRFAFRSCGAAILLLLLRSLHHRAQLVLFCEKVQHGNAERNVVVLAANVLRLPSGKPLLHGFQLRRLRILLTVLVAQLCCKLSLVALLQKCKESFVIFEFDWDEARRRLNILRRAKSVFKDRCTSSPALHMLLQACTTIARDCEQVEADLRTSVLLHALLDVRPHGGQPILTSLLSQADRTRFEAIELIDLAPEGNVRNEVKHIVVLGCNLLLLRDERLGTVETIVRPADIVQAIDCLPSALGV